MASAWVWCSMSKEMFINCGECFREQIACSRDMFWTALLRPFGCKSPQQVCAAHDTDQTAVPHHWHPLDVVYR